MNYEEFKEKVAKEYPSYKFVHLNWPCGETLMGNNDEIIVSITPRLKKRLKDWNLIIDIIEEKVTKLEAEE